MGVRSVCVCVVGEGRRGEQKVVVMGIHVRSNVISWKRRRQRKGKAGTKENEGKVGHSAKGKGLAWVRT